MLASLLTYSRSVKSRNKVKPIRELDLNGSQHINDKCSAISRNFDLPGDPDAVVECLGGYHITEMLYISIYKYKYVASRKNDLSDVFFKIGFMPYISYLRAVLYQVIVTEITKVHS